MKSIVMFVAGVVAVLGRAGPAPAAGVDELPMEIATRLFDPTLIDARLPLGPSAYRGWNSPRERAERMADDLNDKGDVVAIGGFLGGEASHALDRGIRVDLAEHAKVKLVGDIAVDGGADAARAATEAGLKSHRESVDGIIVQAGADASILEAFSEGRRKIPIMTIGDQLASLCRWRHDLDSVDRAFMGWPPAAEMALAWNVATRTPQGQGPKTQPILAESITISGFTAGTRIAADRGLDSVDGFPIDDEVCTSRRTLDSYFLRPADPTCYTP